MRPVKNSFVVGVVCFCSVLLSLAASAYAQQYPVKAVRIVVPAAPGGGTDLIGRVFAQKSSQVFAQSFVVDNKGGAGAALSTSLAAPSPPGRDPPRLTHASVSSHAG